MVYNDTVNVKLILLILVSVTLCTVSCKNSLHYKNWDSLTTSSNLDFLLNALKEEGKTVNSLDTSRRGLKRDVDFEADDEATDPGTNKEDEPAINIEVSKRNYKNHNYKSRSGTKVWDRWGKWTLCSVSCGVGKTTRWRHCVSGGCASGEKEAQIKTCSLPAC